MTSRASRTARASIVLTVVDRPGNATTSPLVPEPQQRLAHRRAAHSEPVGELAVLQLLPGREGAVDDGVAQASVDVVAEQ